MRMVFYIAGQVIPSYTLPILQRVARRFVICPYYHVVSDRPLPHITPLYRHRTIQEFQADLDWLLKYYEPIHWSEIDRYEKEQKPAFCLTFDDGLKEFYTIVAPILEEKGVPCVCFLNSAFVDNKDLMFRYKEALSQQNIDWKRFLFEEKPYMTSEQIRDLQSRGFEFGNHSINHPHFYQLSLPDQLTQTSESLKALRVLFPVPHRLFAFPFGQEYMKEIELKVHAGSNETIFGTANMRPSVRNLYNRIWMEDTTMSAKSIIQGEYLREIAHQKLHDK